MSPFSSLLRELRIYEGFRQSELANALGYEQSYISALEIGTKGPPNKEFVARLIRCLNLDEAGQSRLWDSVELSQRKVVLPAEAPDAVYRFCSELRAALESLHPDQIELMRIALRLPHATSHQAMTPRRMRRRESAGQQEVMDM